MRIRDILTKTKWLLKLVLRNSWPFSVWDSCLELLSGHFKVLDMNGLEPTTIIIEFITEPLLQLSTSLVNSFMTGIGSVGGLELLATGSNFEASIFLVGALITRLPTSSLDHGVSGRGSGGVGLMRTGGR